jgi:hypothetical protein
MQGAYPLTGAPAHDRVSQQTNAALQHEVVSWI